MALFNQNTFNPIYPESNDKRGEIQILNIITPNPVDDQYTQEMRLDLLPIFSRATNTILKTFPVGRQVMYRIIQTTNHMLPWSTGEQNFLNIDGGAGDDSEPRLALFISENVTGYQNYINALITAEIGAGSIQITKVHVIGSNIQFQNRSNTEHTFLHTYDCIFYGQETPNPNPPIPPTPPAPPCEQMTGYTIGKQYPSTPTSPKVSWTALTGGGWEWTLTAKGGGSGTQYVIVQNNGTFDPSVFVVGYSYFLQIETDAIPVAGSTIAISGLVQNAINFNFVITDTANTLYIPLTMLSGSWYCRLTCNAQLPTSGLASTPNISFRLRIFNGTCANP